jgi:predicted porin
MKKKLIAAAVAGIAAVPFSAVAQSSVSIYGNVTLEYAVTSIPGRVTADQTDVPGGSALGFRGEEKLGGGLSAWFQCETSMDTRGIDQVGLCSRNSAIGFRGAFGNIYHGRWDTPFKRALNVGTVGATETGALGASFMAFGGSGGADANGANGAAAADQTSNNRARWKRRETSITNWDSPNFGGLTLHAGATTGNGGIDQASGTTNAKPRVLSFAGIYRAGPLQAAVGYEIHKGFIGQGNPFDGGEDTGLGLAVSYQLNKQIRLGATMLDTEYETGVNATTKKKTYTIGTQVSLSGPHSIEAQYAVAGDTKGNGGNIQGTSRQGVINSALGETGGNQISLWYVNALSKRTTARLGYTRINNDLRAGYALGNNAQTVGQDQKAYGLHLSHRF